MRRLRLASPRIASHHLTLSPRTTPLFFFATTSNNQRDERPTGRANCDQSQSPVDDDDDDDDCFAVLPGQPTLSPLLDAVTLSIQRNLSCTIPHCACPPMVPDALRNLVKRVIKHVSCGHEEHLFLLPLLLPTCISYLGLLHAHWLDAALFPVLAQTAQPVSGAFWGLSVDLISHILSTFSPGPQRKTHAGYRRAKAVPASVRYVSLPWQIYVLLLLLMVVVLLHTPVIFLDTNPPSARAPQLVSSVIYCPANPLTRSAGVRQSSCSVTQFWNSVLTRWHQTVHQLIIISLRACVEKCVCVVCMCDSSQNPHTVSFSFPRIRQGDRIYIYDGVCFIFLALHSTTSFLRWHMTFSPLSAP